MTQLIADIQKDVENIGKIEAVSTMLDVILQTTGMGFAVVARVTNERWVACAVADHINFGLLSGEELVLETTICNKVRQSNEGVIIENADEDAAYYNHVGLKKYGLKSYISMPIYLKNGSFFGTLCAIDPRPAPIKNPRIINLFKLFGELIAFHIDAIVELEASAVRFNEERDNAERREQFIAILAHDLRNPVAAINNAAQLLMRVADAERVTKVSKIIMDANDRVKELIDQVLNFAKGKMGDGIDIQVKSCPTLVPQLSQVIEELRLVNPNYPIETEFDFNEPVTCDARRIAQLFSNLLANAFTHGDKVSPIRVKAVSSFGRFNLSVANRGPFIPEKNINNLFKPFYKGNHKTQSAGLGLGLFIAQEIAIAHGGLIKVSAVDHDICFTFILNS